MKIINVLVGTAFACTIFFGFCREAGAANGGEQVLFKDGFVWLQKEGETVLLEKPIEFPNQVTISTNGTFQVNNHPPRAFEEGQILGADGMLLSPDGRIEPVIDHVALTEGRTQFSINGDPIPVAQDIPLGRDKVLTTDRALIGSDGSWMRVIDGQLFTPDGKSIPAIDTITLQDGKVIVQKEGTQLLIANGRSIMMNDGTKVFGDGQVVGSDGQITQLTEGQIVTIQGVVKLR